MWQITGCIFNLPPHGGGSEGKTGSRRRESAEVSAALPRRLQKALEAQRDGL